MSWIRINPIQPLTLRVSLSFHVCRVNGVNSISAKNRKKTWTKWPEKVFFQFMRPNFMPKILVSLFFTRKAFISVVLSDFFPR